MTGGPSQDEQLDRLARAVPGWLARKLLHGIGWLIAGLGYVVATGIFVGAYLLVLRVMPDFGPLDRLEQSHSFIALGVVIAILLALAWPVGIAAMLVGSTISALGAWIADPEGKHSFGMFASRPFIRFDGQVDFEGRRLSAEARERLELEAQPIRTAWEAGAEERAAHRADVKRRIAERSDDGD
jgi:hypothetical protein